MAQKTGENIVDITYVMMISPALPQPRFYDLCGQTHDLIFDLSIQTTNEIIADILTIPSPSGTEECPPLRALSSDVGRGFVCQIGEVLNKIRASDVPRCLECPAGFFAGQGKYCLFLKVRKSQKYFCFGFNSSKMPTKIYPDFCPNLRMLDMIHFRC